MTTAYYDPILDVQHMLPVSMALVTSYYSTPQRADDSRRLFDAACASMGIDRTPELPLRPSRGYGAALVLAREWGLTDLESRLQSAIEASFEPSFDATTGEFTWSMGLDEPHPRGQYNAFLAAAEAAGPGMWTRLSESPLEPCPQIVDVDFPTMALSRAEWVGEVLHLRLAPREVNPAVWTSFRLVGAEPRVWYLTGLDGATMDVTGNGVIIRVPLVHADLEFTPGSY